jgi:hypothetical protein
MEEFIKNNIDVFYWITIIMLVVATIIIILFSIIQITNNKKSSAKTLFTGGGLLVVLMLSYFVLSSDITYVAGIDISKMDEPTMFETANKLNIVDECEDIPSLCCDGDKVLSREEVIDEIKGTSKMVGMGIWSFYILSIIAVGSIVITEIPKKFRA